MLKTALKSLNTSIIRCSSRSKYTLPELDYSYSALEPIISREILELHHGKHHQTYVNNLNGLVEKVGDIASKNDISGLCTINQNLKFNYGGHINHTIYWKNLSPNGGSPSEQLMNAIVKDFGSFDAMKKQLTAMTIGVQGSGWGWLSYDKTSSSLKLISTSNQDPLESSTGLIPLFAIDVWEHAYYLQYKNVRPDYVNAIWEIANWKDISERYQIAVQ